MVALANMIVSHVVTAVVPQHMSLPDHPQQRRLVDGAVPLLIIHIRQIKLTHTDTETVDEEGPLAS